MESLNKEYNCTRGTITYTNSNGEIECNFNPNCCKLSVFDWLEEIPNQMSEDLYEVRFKNTHKEIFINETTTPLKKGEIVVVEATNGYDVGIVTLSGAVVLSQLKRRKIDIEKFQFKKISRVARATDILRWQEAISKEFRTMIRARELAAYLNLEMKIGDVEYQGDGSKAIFYYIANERVDFRQLIRLFAEEFRIRVEMKQIGARQEAGLIGGIGVCGQELCCSRFMADFKSITTQTARTQDLSLNPQKLAGQCSKLKCCINYEAASYLDAHTNIPYLKGPLDTQEGPLYLVKTDTLKGVMWFSYQQNSMTNMFPLEAKMVREYLKLNQRGISINNINPQKERGADSEFKGSDGEDSISRFDNKKESRGRRTKKNRGAKRGRKKS